MELVKKIFKSCHIFDNRCSYIPERKLTTRFKELSEPRSLGTGCLNFRKYGETMHSQICLASQIFSFWFSWKMGNIAKLNLPKSKNRFYVICLLLLSLFTYNLAVDCQMLTSCFCLPFSATHLYLDLKKCHHFTRQTSRCII